jgi:PEP-CTERM motif
MKKIGILIVFLISGLANAAINGGSYIIDFFEGRDPISTPVVPNPTNSNTPTVSNSLPFGRVALNNSPFSGFGSGGSLATGGLVTGGQPFNQPTLPVASPYPASNGEGSIDAVFNGAAVGEGGAFAVVSYFSPNPGGLFGSIPGVVNFSNASLFFTPATGVSFAGNFPTQEQSLTNFSAQGGSVTISPSQERNTAANTGTTSVAVILIPTVPEPTTWLMMCLGIACLHIAKRTKNLQL